MTDTYWDALLVRAVQKVVAAPVGLRSWTLFEAAYSLRTPARAGYLDKSEVFEELVAAGRAVGLTIAESVAEVNSALRAL